MIHLYRSCLFLNLKQINRGHRIRMTSITSFNGKPPHSWPNIQTGITSTCVVTNIACASLKASVKTTLGVNAPFRAASIITALYNKEYCKAALDVPAFIVLFLPYGKLVSIGIDVVSEAINYYKDQEPLNSKEETASLMDKSKRLDPTNRLNACKILNVPEEEIGDKKLIDLKHGKLIESLRGRQAKVSPIIAAEIENLIIDVNIAYDTLRRVSVQWGGGGDKINF